ncbi:MAG: dienelactone hydrolase family protein [Alphaproteobacteria bacterium]|nr:dienelactone hydrolase family protein [Alphaproteobacteria bacterium]
MIERKIDIKTKDGALNTFITHPDEGGPFPAVLFYQDAPGIREELFEMARRLGTVGYYVMLPNLYYRKVRDIVIDGNQADIENSYDYRKMFELMLATSNTMPVEDTQAMFDHLDREPMVRKGSVGALGYCMGGRFATCAAARYPRIAVIATYCATWMVNDKPDSAHLVADQIKGEIYFGVAEKDDYFPPEQIEEIRRRLTAGGVKHRFETYPGTRHAFAFRDRDTHVTAAEERHWERMFSLFRRHLG